MNAAPPPPPPPPPGPAGLSSCPACHAPIGPNDRFCPACGASTAPGSAPMPPGTAPPVDIRARVEDDRGVLKKLQLLIPGFRGYRQGEDLREADSVLRLQVAEKVHASVDRLTSLRQSLATAGQFEGLTQLAGAIADLTRLEGEIRHAEQGYTGISPALRVNPAGQDKLYEFDYGFAAAAQDLLNAASAVTDPSSSAPAIANIRDLVTRLEKAFRSRIQTIQQVRVP